MYRILKLHRNKPRTKAQGMVEFALALPILLLLVLGIIEFARLMLTYSAVYSASREAARYALGEEPSVNGLPHYRDCDQIRANGVRVGSFGGVETQDFKIGFDRKGFYETALTPSQILDSLPSDDLCSGSQYIPTHIDLKDPPEKHPSLSTGDRILVRVRTHFDPIVPIVNVFSNGFDVESTTARTFYTAIDVRGTPAPTSTRIPSPTDPPTPEPTKTKPNSTPPTSTTIPSETPTITGTLPTETLPPTDTKVPTPYVPSSTPTRTDTPTPTPSPTGPTITPTPSNIPTIDCPSIINFGNPVVGGNLFSILISNRSSVGTPEVTMVRYIQVEWPDPEKYLSDGWFGIYPIVTDGALHTSPYSIWYPDNMYFQGDTIFQLGFDSLLNEEADLPTIVIGFEDDCMIQFEGSPPLQGVLGQ